MYTLSKDYQHLYEIISNGQVAIGFADYEESKLRDVVKIVHRKMGPGIVIGCRGIEYGGTFSDNFKDFLISCIECNLEWVVPEGEQVKKLQAFKDFVRQRLDEMGVPTHPDGEHSKEGCRIGDRLDLIENQMMKGYQQRVQEWLIECFGKELALDGTERAFRFLEESLELVQAVGITKKQAFELVEYVFDRPTGEPGQEVGGVMVTLAALCYASSLSLDQCAAHEYERILTKIDMIRQKHFSKPANVLSPIPGNYRD